ncbi:hypothetical protein [Rarobacter incanus]|uniref:hypothetical protein n=1 Tax=Rarobacter incanus TaxID=153494 RepID=UPI001152BEF4|nr:hypothetical protein [Rarobacter incanus]
MPCRVAPGRTALGRTALGRTALGRTALRAPGNRTQPTAGTNNSGVEPQARLHPTVFELSAVDSTQDFLPLTIRYRRSAYPEPAT